MAYIHTNTHTIKIQCINEITHEEYGSVILDGNVTTKIETLDKEYLTWNYDIVVDRIGDRMTLECTLLNRSEVNTQTNILSLINFIRLSQNDNYNLVVWPFYNSSYISSTMNSFTCTASSSFQIEQLHEFIDSGSNFKITFKEKYINKDYRPRTPSGNEPNTLGQSGVIVG